MVDSLFSFQDAATDYGDLANELLTTVLDGCGSRWTLKTAHTSDDEVRRTALDPPESAKPPVRKLIRRDWRAAAPAEPAMDGPPVMEERFRRAADWWRR